MLGDLGKLIVAKGFKKLPKIQKIARSGHTASEPTNTKRTEKRGRILPVWLIIFCLMYL